MLELYLQQHYFTIKLISIYTFKPKTQLVIVLKQQYLQQNHKPNFTIVPSIRFRCTYTQPNMAECCCCSTIQLTMYSGV